MTSPLLKLADEVLKAAKKATKRPWQERFWTGPIDGELVVCSQGPIYPRTDENLSKVGKDMHFMVTAANSAEKLARAVKVLSEGLEAILYQTQFWDLGMTREKLRLQLELCTTESSKALAAADAIAEGK